MNRPLFDTHCHLYNQRYDQDRDQILEECRASLLGWINIGADLETSIKCREITRLHPDKSWFTAGVHPHDISAMNPSDLHSIHELLRDPACVAAGEMGLDYFYKHSPREEQIEGFKAQLHMARELNKPVVIHVRDAFEDFFEVIDSVGWYRGVVHCFTGNSEQGMKIAERGLKLSFGGMITFPNTADIQNAARILPLESILLETDSPYLSPVPFRGKRNHPRYVEYAGIRLAELRQETCERIFDVTYQNACELFGLEQG